MTRDNITWKEANSDQRQQLLESGGADLIVSTFSITDQRKQVVDFAGPYFVAHQDLLVRRNDTEITGPEALDGKTLCSVPGTTSAAYVTSHFLGNIKLTEKPRFSDCVTALANSEVDAVTTDDVILAGFAAQPQYQGKLKVVGQGLLRRDLRRRGEEGRLGHGRQGQRRPQAVHRRRILAEVPGRQRPALGLQHPRPADTVATWCLTRRTRLEDRPRRRGGPRPSPGRDPAVRRAERSPTGPCMSRGRRRSAGSGRASSSSTRSRR